MAIITLSQNTCSVQTGHIFFLVIRNTIWINRLAKDLCHSLHTRFIIIFTLFWRKSFVNKGRVFSFSCRRSKRFWPRKGMYQTVWKKLETNSNYIYVGNKYFKMVTSFCASYWSRMMIMVWTRIVLTRDPMLKTSSLRLLQ